MTPQELHDIAAPVLAKHPDTVPVIRGMRLVFDHNVQDDDGNWGVQPVWRGKAPSGVQMDGNAENVEVAAALFESCWVRWLAEHDPDETWIKEISSTRTGRWCVIINSNRYTDVEELMDIHEEPTFLEALAAAMLSLPESTREEER